MTATATQPAHKPDNLLGVCNALGEDFGFNPLYLRVALGAGILWNPLAVVATYLALGVLVLATRLLIRDRTPADVAPAEPVAKQPVEANDDVQLPLAA